MIGTCKHKYLVYIIITFSKFVLELKPRGLALTAGAGVTDKPDPQPIVGGHELQGELVPTKHGGGFVIILVYINRHRVFQFTVPKRMNKKYPENKNCGLLELFCMI